MKLRVESPVIDTPRVAQVRGIFDMPEARSSTVEWDVDLPLAEKPWSIGLIVGPSGCGKSTIARSLWPTQLNKPAQTWPADQSILDAFPEPMPVKEVVEILSSVGFSSPPAWLRPFHVLSTGQQFRVTLARLIAEATERRGRLDKIVEPGIWPAEVIVYDEYTSVVDRTVAQIASAALAKSIRAKQLQFVAVTCHEDVEPWLQPDWVYRPAEGQFLWRSLQRRPLVNLEVFRCKTSAWPLFAPHHYLSADVATAAVSFMATWNQIPVAFSAWMHWMGKGIPTKREHRTVTLPDYQGIGIGMAISTAIASMWTALGFNASSTTTHPAFIRSRQRSQFWEMTRAPAMTRRDTIARVKRATTRLTAGFRYVGPPMPTHQAKALLAS